MAAVVSAQLEDDYRAMRQSVGAVWVERDFLSVSGPDAVIYLQGQLSQDVAGLTVGASAPSLLLSPQGKVDALVRVTREADDSLLVDVDGGWGQAVAERLGRFKLRSRLEMVALSWRCLALRGPGSAGVVAAQGGLAPSELAQGGLALAVAWDGVDGVDLVGELLAVPDGIRLCGPDAYQALRVEAGMPAMGSELSERTIPAEAGVVESTVSFTKGCYTGQELVARIDSRGSRVPRRLRGVVVARPGGGPASGARPGGGPASGARPGGEVLPPIGTELLLDGRSVGMLTSVACSPGLDSMVALAYVRREVEPPAQVELGLEGIAVPGEIRELPLVGRRTQEL